MDFSLQMNEVKRVILSKLECFTEWLAEKLVDLQYFSSNKSKVKKLNGRHRCFSPISLCSCFKLKRMNSKFVCIIIGLFVQKEF